MVTVLLLHSERWTERPRSCVKKPQSKMTIRIPWPEGLDPEEIQRRERERDERLRQIKEQQRRELETAVTSRNVRAMGELALAAIERICRAGSFGIRRPDIDDLTKLAPELVIEGEPLVGRRPHLLTLMTLLKTRGDALIGGVVGPTTERFLAAAAHEISEIVVTAEVQARGSAAATKAVAATKEAPAGDGTEQDDDAIAPRTEAAPPTFTPVEKAITLLMRDGRQRKSMRDYAELVGISHSSLSRSEQWQRAWKASEATPAGFPLGTKDADGNLEAWQETEVCENCRQEPITATATVNGEVVRVCEGCAAKLAPRTK